MTGPAQFKPDTPSGDYEAMAPYWRMANDLIEGADAVRAAGRMYLPQLPDESHADYDYRRKAAKFTNVYRDVVESLAAKPFRKEVAIKAGASAAIMALAEDIDGQGNSLHVFAASTFFAGINSAVDWILVDAPKALDLGKRTASVADQKAAGVRPYWVRIPAHCMLAVESAAIGGRQEIVHARWQENISIREGFAEKSVRRIRILERPKQPGGNYGPATWTVYEEREGIRVGEKVWVEIDSGPISIGVIPLVPFIAGRRKGGSWQFVPPMKDAAHLQLDLYRAETDLQNIKTLICFPMLTGQGISPDAAGTLYAGPNRVLYTTNTEAKWSFLEPQATSLDFLAKEIDRIERQLRDIGRQPLTAQTGNLTVVTTAFAASKANSVISAWTLNLKDALEQALKLTAAFISDPSQPEVEIDQDFDLRLDGEHDVECLSDMRSRGDLSRATFWSELKRRGLLSAEFDPVVEAARIEQETADRYPGE